MTQRLHTNYYFTIKNNRNVQIDNLISWAKDDNIGYLKIKH